MALRGQAIYLNAWLGLFPLKNLDTKVLKCNLFCALKRFIPTI